MITTNATRLAIRQTFLDWAHSARADLTQCVLALSHVAADVDRIVSGLSAFVPEALVAEVIDDLVEDGLIAFHYDADTGAQYIRATY